MAANSESSAFDFDSTPEIVRQRDLLVPTNQDDPNLDIRKLPDRAVLVPTLLKTFNGRASLYAQANGRNEPYAVLRTHAPPPTGGTREVLFHYLGHLEPAQFELLSKIVDEHMAKRPPTGTEMLQRWQPTLDCATAIFDYGMELARYCAALAGYSFRGYTLHKSRGVPESVQPPPESNSSMPQSVLNIDLFKRCWAILASIRKEAPGNPVKALDDVHFFLDAVCGFTDQRLCDCLMYTFIEIACSVAAHGRFRPFRKIESRAFTRRDTIKSIREAIAKNRALISQEPGFIRVGG